MNQVQNVVSQKGKDTSEGEFHFECSPWKVKVSSKGLSPEEFGQMLKQALGWRQSLLWLILIMLALGTLLAVFKPEIMEIFTSG